MNERCHRGKKAVDTPGAIPKMAPTSQREPGWLAQLGEHLPYKQRVGGSIPSPPTKFPESLDLDTEGIGYLER